MQVKRKFFLYVLKHICMNTVWELEVRCNTDRAATLDGGEWSASRFDGFISKGRVNPI
jgi:hypothetical protein